MELTTGQRNDQVDIDIDALKDVINIDIPNLRIFVDTIDDKEEVRKITKDQYLYLIVHIPSTQYDESDQKFELVKKRVVEAIKGLEQMV